MVYLGNYLLERLHQLGAGLIQGVPGDYNMGFLDLIEDHPTLSWVGNCNELNAAYSVDGYARTAKRSSADDADRPCAGRIGVVVTTFGVGELSAVNGVAGSFSEHLPVVHIVGGPSTSAQYNHALLHHTLGDGRYDAFVEMSRKIAVGTVLLGEFASDPDMAVRAIDKALVECCRQARPIYISLPLDLVQLEVSDKPLKEKLSLAWPSNEQSAETACLEEILARCKAAQDPVILVDACAIRHNVVKETLELVNASGLSVFCTPMGKSAIDESHPQFGGIYVGSNTVQEIKDRVESADLLIEIGALKSDFNTGNWQYRTPRSRTIDLHSDRCAIGFATYQGVRMKELLPKLSKALSAQRDERLKVTKARLPVFANTIPTFEQEKALGGGEDPHAITQAWLWPTMGAFLRSGDQVVVETGTSAFGGLSMKLPPSALPCFHGQVLWGSIGWALPATLGVALATREEKSDARVVLFIGDGSFQLTAQEVSTMVREGLSPIIFVLANDGYEIERAIQGQNRRYNNTARWDHESFLKTFADVNRTKDVELSSAQNTKRDFDASHKEDIKQSKLRFDRVRTKDELHGLLSAPAFADATDTLRFVEVNLARGDRPLALIGQTSAKKVI